MSMALGVTPTGLQGNANWTIFDTSSINPDGSLKESPDPWGPAVVDTSSGALRMRSTNPVDVADPDVYPPGVRTVFPVANAGLTNAAWNPSLVAPVADVTVRTRVNVGTTSQQSILLRANGAEGYALTASGATNDFALARFDGGIQSRVEFTEGLDFQVGEDWMLEARAIGDQISLKAWPDGADVPSEPQIQWTDTTYPGGGVLLNCAVWTNMIDKPTLLDVAFDDVSITGATPYVVPEPASSVLGLVGLLCAGVARAKRRR